MDVTQGMMDTPNVTKPPFNPICRSRQAPYAHEIIEQLDITGMLLFAILTFMTLVAVLVFLEEAFYIYRKLSGTKRTLIIWVNSAAPVIAVTCCVGMWIPRSTMFTDFTASLFLAVLIHKFQMLLVSECGGKRGFLSRFSESKLQLNTGPLCCCCVCFPKKNIHSRTLFILKLGTFQFLLLRPVLMFLAVVLWTNGTFAIGDSRAQSATIYINVLVGVITITALWAVGVMFNLVRPSLVEVQIISKFACYQFIVILSQLQTSIINILGTTGVISCVPPLPGPSRASYMNQQLLIMEMFLTTVITRMLYRRRYEEKPALSEDEETKDNLQNSTLCLNGKVIDEGPQKV
ncbi:organic solute transporter subunit alpha-like [Hyla sarda]|uniref:organic solute transporter subunit alpha-like n=1 Tax=Hyla sarda TaxID=327740 RepID=UPI0024C25329|nr:organic solute transporter subunit alpha-like [Hyla sarda]XP_056414757.1 organic solute transporter subunit alpha-like [Hyla sarda]XP_056414758.1 organic solute transporter subunit alpha-like [Hyla sarda]XP_056414759.1 organic solute transporter subunit alpha-like [Hyla sarda]